MSSRRGALQPQPRLNMSLPRIPATERGTRATRGRRANRAQDFTRSVDPAVLADLRQAKAVSISCLPKKQRTARFRRFVNSASLDRFLLECQAYVDLLFQDKTPPDDDAEEDADEPLAPEEQSAEARALEVEAKFKAMAQAYAFILMKEGHNYHQTHNEEMFFEALYDFTVRVTNQRFGPNLW